MFGFEEVLKASIHPELTQVHVISIGEMMLSTVRFWDN